METRQVSDGGLAKFLPDGGTPSPPRKKTLVFPAYLDKGGLWLGGSHLTQNSVCATRRGESVFFQWKKNIIISTSRLSFAFILVSNINRLKKKFGKVTGHWNFFLMASDKFESIRMHELMAQYTVRKSQAHVTGKCHFLQWATSDI